MPLILVVEPEGRFVERIRDALAPEGWSLRVVVDREGALSTAASLAPNLVMVSTKVVGAADLLNTFARKRGGPGVIVLMPETPSLEEAALEAHADHNLEKPFTDAEIRRSVRAAARAGEQEGGDEKDDSTAQLLTSRDIFGDLLEEVDSDEDEDDNDDLAIFEGAINPPTAPSPAEAADDAPPAAPEPPAAPAAPAAPEPTPSQPPEQDPAARRKAASDDVDRRIEESLAGLVAGPPAGRSDSGPGARPTERATPPPKPARDDVGRRLEESLSGLGARPTPTHSAKAEPKRAPKTVAPSGSDEIDDLLNQTLMGLDLASTGLKKAKKSSSPKPHGDQLVPDQASGQPSEEAIPPAGPRKESSEDAAALQAASPEQESPEETSPEKAAPPETADKSAAPAPASSGGAAPFRAFTEPGQEFGQYTLLEKIAVGGMAEVWKARMDGMEGFQKTVAIKKILAHLTGNSGFVNMFIDEAKLAAQLNHPNITHIYDLGKIEDDYYIAMEFVEGKNLRSILSATRLQKSRLPIELSVLIAARLASALDYAHRKRGFDGDELGLVHRDVSPQNVLISFEGDIKLCDFGIVKAVSKSSHTQLGALKGKLQYMSPEQAWGRPVDSRSDLFSLGALLFEMLTGRRLFAGDSEMSVLEKVRQGVIPSPRSLEPSVPEEIDQLVMRALARDPEERYQTASEMRKDLETLLHGLDSTPRQADLAAFMHKLEDWPAGALEGEADSFSLTPAIPEPEGLPDPPPIPDLSAPEPAATAPTTPSPTEPSTGSSDGPDASAKLVDIPPDEAPEPPPAATPVPSSPTVDDEASDDQDDEVVVEPLDPRPDQATATRAAALLDPVDPPEEGAEVTDEEEPPEEEPPTGAEESAAPPADGEVEALAPAGDAQVDPEEGGSRGRGRLIAAIIALVLVGIVVAYFVWRSRSSAAETAGDPATVTDAQQGGESVDGATEEGADGETEATDAETAPAPTEDSLDEATNDQIDLADAEAAFEEELAKLEEKRRQEYEAEQKRLEEELAKAQAEAEQKRIEEEERLAAEAELEAQQEADRKAEEERQKKAQQEADRKAEEERQKKAQQEADRKAEEERQRLEEEAKPHRGDLVTLGTPGLVPPKLKTITNPTYPTLARRLRVQGEVEIEALVDENGAVTDVRITKPHNQNVGLNEAAVEAARSARFEPATLEGVAVKVWTKLRIPFKL